MAASIHGITRVVECGDLNSALNVLSEHERETNSKFAVYTATKDFGTTSIQRARKVYWEDQASVRIGRQEFSGVPFVVLGIKRFDCQFGRDRKMKSKKARKRVKGCNDHDDYTKGKKFLFADTKKMDCPAQCLMREICRFPSYKYNMESMLGEDLQLKNVDDNTTQFEKKVRAEDLLCRLQAGEAVSFERCFITCLADNHEGHPVTPEQVIPEPIDKRLAQKIHDLVLQGIINPGLIRVQLCQYVKEVMPDNLPHPTNRRFYPSDKTIRNHIYQAKKTRLADDQKNLCEWISELQKNSTDFIFCRLKSEKDEILNKSVQFGSKFLLVYQSKNQKRLLSRYGSTVFMDATYKTTTYDLPLFFLAVKTNVDYQVVGAFITEDECTDSISEALMILKTECFVNNPPYFMTDFDECEITALEKVFPDSQVLLCDFH